jgi:hypothetical protein
MVDERDFLYGDCKAVAASGARVGEVMAEHGKGEPNEVQLRCVGEALAAYPVAERRQVLDGGIGGVPAGLLRERVRELLVVCGLDGSVVASE